MTLFLDEATVHSLVDMDDALEEVENAFRAAGTGGASNVPRIRVPLGDGTLRITAAVLPSRGYYGVKVSSSTVFASGAGRVFYLYEHGTGRLVAAVQVFGLGTLRTGAVTGVATKHLANADATSIGVIGTGRQARTQVWGVSRVRRIDEIRVFGRDSDRLSRFCADLVGDGYPATPVGTAQEAVQDADIVVTATTATKPVLHGAWLTPGTHVNAVGANYEHRRELDTATVERAAVIVTDDPEQARYEASDLAFPAAEGALDWERVRGLDEIVAGDAPGRESHDQITLFESLGVALGDVALVARAYERAVVTGAGEQIPDLSK